MTIEGLLSKAGTYYKVKKQNNTWGELSKEEEELISMKSLMIKDKHLQVDDESKIRKKKKASSRPYGNGQGDNNNKIPKWKLENPKNKSKINKNDKTYFWCKNHNNDKGMWVLHSPDQCRNKAKSNTPTSETESCENNEEKVMKATVEEQDDSSCSSEESE